jgi:hypothetical protein
MFRGFIKNGTSNSMLYSYNPLLISDLQINKKQARVHHPLVFFAIKTILERVRDFLPKAKMRSFLDSFYLFSGA